MKHDAPELLRQELASKRWEPQPIAMCGVTDPYQPAERRFEITRGCLQVLAEFRNPVDIVTKNHLVTRDIDLLADLASTPARRLEAVRRLSETGIPVRVLVAPVVPGLTDHEMPGILAAARDAGARAASYIPLRLPYGLKGLFEEWLGTHFPDRKDKVLNRIREMRGGKLYDAQWGTRMRGEGIFADQYHAMFSTTLRKMGMDDHVPILSTAAFRRPHTPAGQMALFE